MFPVVMIAENVRQIMGELPPGVHLVAAAKRRTSEEVLQVVQAGIKIIGESYVQQAERDYAVVGNKVEWHLIGHLQTNKAKKAVKVFDMIETVDSVEIAREIDSWCAKSSKLMPVLIEVNIAREEQKSGVSPEDVERLIAELVHLSNIRVMGLMTMGPRPDSPETLRPYFHKAKRLFDHLQGLNIPGVEMKYLSMGMSGSYKVAIEEGANMVRLGTGIFGTA